MQVAEQRDAAVADTVAQVRVIETAEGVSPSGLKQIRAVLLELAAEAALFPLDAFPGPEDGKDNRLYPLSIDDDGRFALYLNRGSAQKDTPPHNHTTWAVVVGVRGEELNRFYAREDDGSGPGMAKIHETGTFNVTPGTGVCLMPDDIHSIHMRGTDPKLHLHMYGLAINRLSERLMFDMEAGTCKVFPPHRDAR